MRLRAFEWLSRGGRRLIWGGALLTLLVAAGTTAIGDVTDEAKRSQGERPASFGLFAGPTAVLTGNQLQCGLVSAGEVCKDVFDSPTGNGGFWPTGSPNGYIFNTGLQIAGIIGEDGGPWANDTVAGYFFDARGNQRSGTSLTDIFVSTDPDDAAAWPEEARITNADLFDESLIERDDNRFASQEDSWVQYWEGDPVRITNRQHPMGITVTQRSLAWNFPSGNESVLYFIYDFANVTTDAEFQSLNEAAFFGGDNVLPDGGYTINEMFAAFATDMDVTLNAGENFSTAILPFDIGLSYHGGFTAADFIYPPDLFFPPFFIDAPGLIGVKYLKSPVDPITGQEVGLTLFSNTQNPSSPGAQFVDPLGDKQLWRYLSGRLDPSQGDPPCNIEASIITGDPRTTVRPLCFIFQQASDTRFYQSSGPFSIEPGDVGTIVVAYIIAPTVNVPEITAQSSPNTNPPGVPSFHPTFPSERACDANGANCAVSDPVNAVLPIELGAGWIDYIDRNLETPDAIELGENKVDQRNIAVVPGSLLGRALVAQTVFDSKFLLGSAPAPPPFYLVPGDAKVTVIWDESPTEQIGDPFFEAASDPENALFNPNYRQFDVEGYRVWRGVDPGTLQLLAQYDKAKSNFTDKTCETVPATKQFYDYTSSLSAGFGYAAGEPCPYVATPFDVPINSGMVFNNGTDGGAPGGGVVRAASGAGVAVSQLNVIIDDDAGPRQPATDTGIPFSFVDSSPVNNFTYWYAVSAFDVNSQASGPHSLRSLRNAVQTVPRASNSALQAIFDADVLISGDDGVALDLTQSNIAPDVDTGIFPGPQPPTNALDLLITPPPAEVADLLTSGSLVGVFDSVTAEDVSFGCTASGGNGLGACLVVHMTFDNGLEIVSSSLEIARPVWDSFGEPASVAGPLGAGAYPFDGERLAEFGIPPDAGAGVAVGLAGSFDMSISDPSNLGQRVRRFPTGRYQPGGNRWFDGTVEVTPDPTTFIRAGHIDGIDSVWAPIHHTEQSSANLTPLANSGQIQCFGYTMAILSRAADFQVTWGEGGTVTVRDITHNVPVDFKEAPQMSYGFLNTDGNGNGVIDWHDFDFLDVIRQASTITNAFCSGNAATRSVLAAAAQIQPVFLGGGLVGDPMPATGNGFAMYINGERYIFLTDNLPAAGTVWTYRTYNGRIRATPGLSDDPSGYELRGGSGSNRPPAIPNMVFTLDVKEAGVSQVADFDLREVHTVPDPYLATSQYDRSPTNKTINFVNLPPEATIRIYTLTGVLVSIIDHDDATGGGRARWDVRNRNNQFVASGVYFFHVVTPDKDEYVGKFTVVNFAGQN